MKTHNTNLLMQNKDLLAVPLVTGVLLMVPLVAMQVTSEVDWNIFDFVVMGTLISTVGFSFVVASRLISNKVQLAVVGLTLLVAFLWIWAELAVGVFTNWGS